MPPLWKRVIRHPASWLALLGLVAGLAGLDAGRAPARQWTGRAYCAAVRGYQTIRGEWLGRFVTCRFEPSCSHYSHEAVRRHGIREGLALTWSRLGRCRSDVAPDTPDPVPGEHGGSRRVSR